MSPMDRRAETECPPVGTGRVQTRMRHGASAARMHTSLKDRHMHPAASHAYAAGMVQGACVILPLFFFEKFSLGC